MLILIPYASEFREGFLTLKTKENGRFCSFILVESEQNNSLLKIRLDLQKGLEALMASGEADSLGSASFSFGSFLCFVIFLDLKFSMFLGWERSLGPQPGDISMNFSEWLFGVSSSIHWLIVIVGESMLKERERMSSPDSFGLLGVLSSI